MIYVNRIPGKQHMFCQKLNLQNPRIKGITPEKHSMVSVRFRPDRPDSISELILTHRQEHYGHRIQLRFPKSRKVKQEAAKSASTHDFRRQKQI